MYAVHVAQIVLHRFYIRPLWIWLKSLFISVSIGRQKKGANYASPFFAYSMVAARLCELKLFYVLQHEILYKNALGQDFPISYTLDIFEKNTLNNQFWPLQTHRLESRKNSIPFSVLCIKIGCQFFELSHLRTNRQFLYGACFKFNC